MMTSSNGNIVRDIGRLCAGNSPVTGEFPSQKPVAIWFFYLRGWVNNREASDLRPDHVHYDVTEMVLMSVAPFTNMV